MAASRILTSREDLTGADARWQAVLARDRAADGQFFYGVVTTGIYCRPHCPSPRPRRENARFFATGQDAEAAGFRPCRRCRPERAYPGLGETAPGVDRPRPAAGPPGEQP